MSVRHYQAAAARGEAVWLFGVEADSDEAAATEATIRTSSWAPDSAFLMEIDPPQEREFPA